LSSLSRAEVKQYKKVLKDAMKESARLPARKAEAVVCVFSAPREYEGDRERPPSDFQEFLAVWQKKTSYWGSRRAPEKNGFKRCPNNDG